ncbi:hypothetical protein [Variovorax sp. YR216]|uniref:hypothetical protein n=1 Tax=Variovorax sp. YR216 TaxID=1882828 RepID=UPI000895AADF|nr:hypothetical protein [Variovorax sp. YR216]SEA03501.1 hypothetical protein SAMN05444680_101273 [Variovorax sp. YR216]
MGLLKKLLRVLAAIVIVPVLLFEEWGWEPLARWVAQLARLPIWARVEQALRNLSPWAAVLAFFAPMVLLFPIKIIGLLLLAEGHAKSAVTLLLAAKLVGTAILARLFQLVEPALMRIPLFARWYPRWKAWKDRLMCMVRQSPPWRIGRGISINVRRSWRSFRRAR